MKIKYGIAMSVAMMCFASSATWAKEGGASVFPLEQAQDYLEKRIEEQSFAQHIKIESARFVLLKQNKQYGLHDIALLGFEGDYFIKQLKVQNSQNFSATLSSSVQNIQVQGRFADYVEVPVLMNNVARGHIVKESDIAYIEVPSRVLRRHMINDVNDMIGKETKRRIIAGKPVLVRDVVKPVLVKKGGVIKLVYSSPTMELKSMGVALAHASAGDIIRIKNTRSGAVIRAMVTKDSVALVNYDALDTEELLHTANLKRG